MTLQPCKRTMSKCCCFSKERAGGRTSKPVGGCWGFNPARAGISCATAAWQPEWGDNWGSPVGLLGCPASDG